MSRKKPVVPVDSEDVYRSQMKFLHGFTPAEYERLTGRKFGKVWGNDTEGDDE